MGNQKFTIHGHSQLTLGAASNTELAIAMQQLLPIAFYIKKILLYFENDSSLTKNAWITWHLKDTTQYDAVIEDSKYMGLQNITQLAPVNGLDVYSFFRPISMNYSPQFALMSPTDGAALMIEQYVNHKVSAGNTVELEIDFDTVDDGNQAGTETIDVRITMECVVA